MNINKEKKQHNVIYYMFMYWFSVIIWQTIRPVANRSIIDTVVKIALFSILIIFAIKNSHTKNSGEIFMWLLIFTITQTITLLLDTAVVLSTIITVVFMFVQILIFLVLLSDEKISNEDICWFGKYIIMAAFIMSLYNMTFNFGKFIRVFSLSFGAYGSECKSFLYSNHEFAVYLSTGIIFALWELFKTKNGKIKNLFLIVIFSLNLFSTYSRTAILGVLAALLILSFFFNFKYFVGIIILYASILVSTIFSSKIYDFVFNKIFKGSYEQTGSIVDQGRSDMYKHEWNYFVESNILQKIFGKGYIGGSTDGHDAYLYILNIGGIVMFLFFICIILFAIRKSIVCLKFDKNSGSLCLAFQAFCLLYMVAQTPILFFSTMDSYFITILTVIIPLYISNYLKSNSLKYQNTL